MYSNNRYYHRKNQVRNFLNTGLMVLAVVGAVVFLASVVYMRYLYASGEISAQDYARSMGQPPTVIIVNPQ